MQQAHPPAWARAGVVPASACWAPPLIATNVSNLGAETPQSGHGWG